jgi:hypothetical protein
VAGEIPGLNIQVTIDSTGVTAGVSRVTDGLKSIENQTRTTGSALTNFKNIAVGVFGGNLLTQGLIETQKGLVDMIKAVTDAQAGLAKLSTALNNAKQNTAANREEIDKTSQSMSNLGFETADTDQAYSNLVTSTGSVTEATKLMSMAADLARYKHESLATAATTLARGTQGSVKAFKELGISLDTTLPKNEAIAKAFDELNQKIGGQAVAYTDTFAGKLDIMKSKLNDATVAIGSALLPVLSNLMTIVMDVGTEIGKLYDTYIKPLTDFVKENAAAFEVLIGVLGGAYVAFKTYEIGMNLFKAAQIVYIAMTSGMTAAQTALTFATEAGSDATKAMTVVQAALNAVMEANPIGLVVVAVAALAAGFVLAWNHIKPFRDAVVDVASVAVRGFGDFIQILGDVVTAIEKVVTGPLKLMLEAMSHLPIVGKGAKDALSAINTGVSDTGKFFDSSATSIVNMGKSLDDLKNKKISLNDIFGGGATETTLANAGGTSTGGDTGVTGAVPGGNTTKAAVAAAKKDVTQLTADSKQVNTIYNDMTTALKDYATKYATLQDDKNKRDIAANDAYQKAVTAANDTYDKAMSSAQESFDATSIKAHQTYTDTVTKINDTFQASSLAALTTYNDSVQKATDANNAAVLKLNTDAADKQQALVDKSKAELTDAFQKATTVDLGKSFTGTATGLAQSLQDQLDQMKQLAADAAKLGGLGYSQQFIQQVVSQGPVLGDQMAQSLIDAQPGTTKQIQNLFDQIQDISSTGLNNLADSLNQNGILADQSLQAQYNQVGTDLQTALANQQSTFNDSLAAAKTTYDDAITKATQTQQDALAAAQDTLDQTIADATEKLQTAQAAAKTALDDSLATASQTLQDALTASQTTFDQAVSALHDSTMSKLNDLQAKLEAVATAMSNLGVAGQASAGLALGGSIATPYISGAVTLGTNTDGSFMNTPGYNAGQTPITINQTNNIDGSTSPSDIANATTNAILYGVTQTVVSNPSMRVGANF